MAKINLVPNYFETRPDIVKIFEDLESYHDFCRFEMIDFNQAELYNRRSKNWQAYEASKGIARPRRQHDRKASRK